MDMFLYFGPSLPVGLDELEDAVNEALDGRGVVTGAGRGENGSNLDISIKDMSFAPNDIISLVRSTLAGFALPKSSWGIVENQRFSLT